MRTIAHQLRTSQGTRCEAMDDPLDSQFTLDFVRERVNALYQKIGASREYVTFGWTRGDSTPCIDIKEGYHFVTGINGTPLPVSDKKSYLFIVNERGNESKRSTSDLDELLYWIFDGVTSSMASDFERLHRRKGEDFRRLWFSKHLELLSQLSLDWASRTEKYLCEVSKEYPFQDE
jgi:hypothetical protein